MQIKGYKTIRIRKINGIKYIRRRIREKIQEIKREKILIYTEGEEEMSLESFLDTLFIKKEKMPKVGLIPGTSYVLYKETSGLWHIERITSMMIEKLEKMETLEFDEEKINKDLGNDEYEKWKKKVKNYSK